MIATALVGIGVDFHAGPGTTATLVSVLYLFSAVAQPTMGKLSTIFGARRIFVIGVAILLVAGVVGTLAPAFWVLFLSRALIGIGTSAAYPTAMALVRRRADERGIGVPARVLGNFSIAAQVTAVIGLPLGGVLAGAFGWRALFAVNIPLAVISIVLTLVGVAKDPPIAREGRDSLLVALDVPGIVLFGAATTSLLLFFSDLKSPPWWALASFVVAFTALILWERRTLRPLIDVRMLARNRPLQRTYLRQLLVGLGIYTAVYGSSQWLEEGRGLDASTVGLILIPFSAFSIVLARLVSGRAWIRWPLILSGVGLLATAAVMLVVDSASPIWLLIAMTMLFGLTNGLSGFANQAALYVQTSSDEIAVAAGLYRTSSYIGAIFSSSLIGITFGSSATDAGLHAVAWVLAGIGAIVVLLVVFDRTLPIIGK
jgi:predicted MFS family arabinose efflux permease